MQQECYFAPRSERWVVAAIAKSVAIRLAIDCTNPSRIRSIMRLLFGLQRFPRVTPGLIVQICWKDLEAYGSIGFSEECLSIEFDHTRLQYFVGSHHLLRLYDNLSGWERKHWLENWLPQFDRIEDPTLELSVEDYSDEQESEIDTPPLNEQWQQPLSPIYFDLELQAK